MVFVVMFQRTEYFLLSMMTENSALATLSNSKSWLESRWSFKLLILEGESSKCCCHPFDSLLVFYFLTLNLLIHSLSLEPFSDVSAKNIDIQ